MITFLKSFLISFLVALITFQPLYASALRTAFAKEIEQLNRKKEILIHLTLLSGKRILLRYANHTDMYMEGYLVKFDAGNRATQKEITKILFEEIESYKLEKQSPLKGAIFFAGLAAGVVLVGALLIIVQLTSHDWN